MIVGTNLLRHGGILNGHRLRRPSPACRHPLPVNGARDAVTADFANLQRSKKGAGVAASHSRPVYGERCPAGQ